MGQAQKMAGLNWLIGLHPSLFIAGYPNQYVYCSFPMLMLPPLPILCNVKGLTRHTNIFVSYVQLY